MVENVNENKKLSVMLIDVGKSINRKRVLGVRGWI